MTADLLTSHPFTKGFWPEHVIQLAAMAGEVLFAPGELIFHEGDHSSFFYLLISGNVALEVVAPGHPVRVATLYAGDVLGWSSVTGETSKQFQARALEPVHALAFDGARLGHACEKDYAFGFAFLRAIVSVLSGRLHAVRGQLVEAYTPRGGGMNIGAIRERRAFDRRVALTPAMVRQLAGAGHTLWVETGACEGAMFGDSEYVRAGAHIAYSPAEVVQRVELLAKIGRPTAEELGWCRRETAVMAFYHMAVADRGLLDALAARSLTAVGCEVIQQDDGRLPVLAAISEIAGQMTVPIASHLLRSSSGGRGILLGGTAGVPPARVVVVGAGTVGFAAARGAAAAGGRVTAFDCDSRKLRHVMEHVPGVETGLADAEAIAEAVAAADVVIGAVLVAGTRTPHVVTRAMVESMKPGSAILDVSIDQGGCVETSRPTTLADPTFVHHGVTHFSVPNFTADVGRTSSIAISQAMLPYLLMMATHGAEAAIRKCPDLARGAYTLRGERRDAARVTA